MSRTAVLAYSGGLDTTCAVAWLREDYGFDEVIAVLVDVGQTYDIEEAQLRGKAAGAADVLLLDRRDAFANVQVAAAIKTNALYEAKYPLVSALSRPVIAEAVVRLTGLCVKRNEPAIMGSENDLRGCLRVTRPVLRPASRRHA